MPTATTVPVKMAQRRDTAANWTSANPTLLAGEIGIESDTSKIKLGTGSTAWASLSYTPWSQVSTYPFVNADIASGAAIAYSKLATLTSGNIVLGSSANVATSTAVTGDVTISNTGVTAIASGVIVNADINASAGIVDTKLATIATAGKVSNSATTATSANTASAIVARDASGNFTAGTITAALTGTASGNLVSGGALGTPSSGTLTSCTGLPISTGVSGLGTGAATFLATPSSANFAALLTDETGTGSNVFATSPTLVTPALGTPSSGNLTNCTFPTLNQSTTGNAATVTTNANLTGDVTSVGNATAIASNVIVNADVNASAAIAGTKISPDFGAQNITTTGNVTINSQGDVRFGDADSSNWIAFQAPATVAANITWTLPSVDGTSNQVLKTNGAGTLSWSTPTAGGVSLGLVIALS
jgi:serine acetyltransferase